VAVEHGKPLRLEHLLAVLVVLVAVETAKALREQ
jgi:hypothetical protein